MHYFNSGSFSDLADTQEGQRLWDFLNDEVIVIRLETATYLGRPAIEAIQLQLLRAFGPTMRENRWKQLVGAMVRQVLERYGYVFIRSGVRTKVKDLFSTGATYRIGRTGGESK